VEFSFSNVIATWDFCGVGMCLTTVFGKKAMFAKVNSGRNKATNNLWKISCNKQKLAGELPKKPCCSISAKDFRCDMISTNPYSSHCHNNRWQISCQLLFVAGYLPKIICCSISAKDYLCAILSVQDSCHVCLSSL
jgi:hypothetical protein